MNILEKNIKLNINISYLEKNNLNIKKFLNSANLRNQIINNILDENLNYKSFIINNIIFLNKEFVIDITISIYLTTILEFKSLNETLLFCTYLQDNIITDNNTFQNLSLYYFNNNYYLIIENNINIIKDKNINTYNIKSSDFNTIKFTPLIYSIITQKRI